VNNGELPVRQDQGQSSYQELKLLDLLKEKRTP
jgi:hypothetical protein